MINYNGKIFRPANSSKNSETSNDTVFTYKQNGAILTADYAGGNIKKGHLIGLVDAAGVIEMRYHQVNTNNQLMTGKCTSTPEILPNGKIRLHEKWQWTSGDKSTGNSILDEE
ncbi:n-acetylglutamate synthase [Cellulophaga lytica]|uniref:n-acetylglutamate synthase n=1 Tax=Cellulophaga lytica TaxID=979 RepID=UPI000950517E|nr:n-acetylglutamate synthase [Cellulophaga lytica]APU09608.1 n-acetylglutamate synthase [Cellulophaga lytica]